MKKRNTIIVPIGIICLVAVILYFAQSPINRPAPPPSTSMPSPIQPTPKSEPTPSPKPLSHPHPNNPPGLRQCLLPGDLHVHHLISPAFPPLPAVATESPSVIHVHHLISPASPPQFPWPPPKASATENLPNIFFSKVENHVTRLDDVDTKINKALESCGYYDRSYFVVPDGYALVTRL